MMEIQEHKKPFDCLPIDDVSILNSIEGRRKCFKCGKSRKLYCYSCFIPIDELKGKIPQVKLPIKVDIIKHRGEIDGKSTSAHAKLLAPDDVQIFDYPEIPNYSTESGVYLVFPSAQSINIQSLFNGTSDFKVKENFGLDHGIHMGTMLRMRLESVVEDEERHKLAMKEFHPRTRDDLPIRRAVFIDATWNQSRSIYKDEKINQLKTIVLQNRLSQFWRHQKGSPRWFLATVEAIHQLVVEVHCYAWGMSPSYVPCLESLETKIENVHLAEGLGKDEEGIEAPYKGQYDNLLFFFKHMYALIHTYYDSNQLIAYKRPIL